MRTKKELGQHWLHDEQSLQSMCDMASIDAGDVVLEIGPGLGTLTEKLVKIADSVIAVEYDYELYQQLPKRVSAKNLTVVHKDILRFDLTQMAADYKVIANIPYYLTSNLIRVLSESSNPPRSATLLIQKEVAERLAAGPGGMSLLSVTAQMYFEPALGPIVKAELFTPAPKIDSQIILLQRRAEPLYGDINAKVLFQIVKAGFSNRRKTLLNSLSAGLHKTKPETQIILDQAAINAQLRPQDLDLDDWIRLTTVIKDTV